MTIDGGLHRGLGTAVAVLAAWVMATVGLGARKTASREI